MEEIQIIPLGPLQMKLGDLHLTGILSQLLIGLMLREL